MATGSLVGVGVLWAGGKLALVWVEHDAGAVGRLRDDLLGALARDVDDHDAHLAGVHAQELRRARRRRSRAATCAYLVFS